MSILALLASFIVYFITKAPTVSFWDCGEFIASSYIMGVAHPPGYPMYIILGRFFTLLPIAGDIAVRVNILSVLGGAASVFAAYWLILRVILGRGFQPTGLGRIGIGLGALSGALIMGFSRTFWANAVEAEVYTLSMFLMLVIHYLVLTWAQDRSENRNDNLLILISYLAWFSLGIHMTTFIIVLPAVMYLAYVDYKENDFARWPVWAIMAFFFLYAFPIHIEIVRLIGFDISSYELETFIFMFGAIFIGVALITVITRIRKSASFKVWILSLGVLASALIGFSSQAYIPIRAAHNPAINENDPSTWGRFKGFMERKQYGQESMVRRMMKRRGSWVNQLITHPRFGFLGVFNSQYADPEAKITIFESGQGKGRTDFSVSLPMIYILIIGLYGVFELSRGSPADGMLMIFITLLCTIGLVVYINFSDGLYNTRIAPFAEVRARDYFYTPGFMYYGIIIGIGLSYLLAKAGRFADTALSRKKIITGMFGLSCLLAVGMAVHTTAANFEHNDRRGNYLPFDYAKNILDSCDPDAIIFTNGDNDTFPLWYIQQVEKYRVDVKVANLSLLNTSWYIRQLKDNMNVPITFSDSEIDELRTVRLANSGTVYRIQDQMLHHILTNIQSGGWITPVYFAITVPTANRIGIDDNLVMEGMAYRVVESPGQNKVNTEIGLRIFGDPGNFRGIADESVTKDANDRKLINNYLVAIFKIADEFYKRGQIDSAMVFTQLALDLQPVNTPWQIDAYLARLYGAMEKYEEIARLAEKSPEGENIYLLASQDLLKEGELGKAKVILEMTLARYPSSVAALNNLSAVFYQNNDMESFDLLVAKFRAENGNDPKLLAAVDQVVERLKRLPAFPINK